jgi:hypothetical protein
MMAEENEYVITIRLEISSKEDVNRIVKAVKRTIGFFKGVLGCSRVIEKKRHCTTK